MRIAIEIEKCPECPCYSEHNIVKEEPGIGEPNKHYFCGGFCGSVKDKTSYRMCNGGIIRDKMIGEWDSPENREIVTAKIPDWCPYKEES